MASRFRQIDDAVYKAENAIGRRVYRLSQPITKEQFDAIIKDVQRRYLKKLGVEIDKVIVHDDYPYRIVLKQFDDFFPL